MLASYRNDLKPIADLAQSFAARELAGKTAEHDRYPFGEFYGQVLNKAHEVGFLGVILPESLGGLGGGLGGGIAALCEILIQICEADASPGGIIFTQALSQQLLLAAGAWNLTQTFPPEAASSKDLLIAYPVYTNPAQTDSLPLAQKTGGDYTLTGKLELLVLGNLARQAIIPARLGIGPSYSFFLVDLHDQNMGKSEPVFTLGLHACPAVDVTFSSARALLIGEENEGHRYFEKVSPEMNAAAAAMNAGILRGVYNEAVAYSQKREQGGRPIINWSEIGMMLASILVKADVAAMCVCQSCLELEQKKSGYETRVSAAALHIAELSCDATSDGIQILGGYGYMKDYGQEKRYRDARMVQALLGAVPLKKLELIRQATNTNPEPCVKNTMKE
jgi:alkylation response protein AidB-like acyl-CoA dehydrogenase